MAKLVLKCPACKRILYELEEKEPFVVAGKCKHCGKLITFKPEKNMFELDQLKEK